MEFQSKTRDGHPVKIFTQECRDKKYSIVGEVLIDGKWSIRTWTKEGSYCNYPQHRCDLIPLHKFEVDDKVLVRDHESHLWKRSYFASYADGMYYVFNDGRTSFTTTNVSSWKYCIPYASITDVA